MNRFDALLQQVSLLNAQPQLANGRPGCEVRMLLHRQLWSIVEQLNRNLGLGLDNTCLDLTVDGDRLRIHYFPDAGCGSAESETDLFIDRYSTVERRKIDLATGRVEIR